MVCFGTPEAFKIKSGFPPLPKASFPAKAPIWSTSISDTRRSRTPDFSIIHSTDFPILGAMSFAVSILGGRYNPTPVILIFIYSILYYNETKYSFSRPYV